MDKYPSYLLRDPKPLVFVQGSVDNEPDFLPKLNKILDSTSIEMTDIKENVNMEFRSISVEHDFLGKKPSKEHINLDGVLRDNWIQKHRELLPSVVILVTTFSVDWSSSEWMRREATFFDRYTRVKNAVAGRDVKIVILPVRVGVSQASIDKDVIDERIVSLKRHLQIDSKLLLMMTMQEISGGSTPIRRLIKTVRDLSTNYYTAQGKRARSIEKGSNVKGTFENIVAARYSFKVGYFNEFLGQRAQSLKYYKLGFQALASAAEIIEEDLIDQVKMVADYTNFKICSIYLRSGAVREATSQFKSLVIYFGKVYSDMAWRHQSWLSNQYVVYAQLLDFYGCPDPFGEIDKSYLYQNAARYASRTQSLFARIRNTTQGAWQSRGSSAADSIDGSVVATSEVSPLQAKFAGMIALPPRYVGAMPMLLDPMMGQNPQLQTEEMARFIRSQIEDKERAVDHGTEVMRLLQLTLDCIDMTHVRRRALIKALMGDQHMILYQFQEAYIAYSQAADGFCKESWVDVVVPVLRKRMTCALYIGRSSLYLHSAITLFSLGAANHLSKYEKEGLHKDIFSIISAQGSDPVALAATNSFFSKPDFGSFVRASGSPVEYSLPNNYLIEFSESAYSKMFDVKVTFDRPSVELGHHVRVTVFVTSQFAGLLTFAEMSVCFSGETLIRRFVHDGSGSGDSLGGVHESEEDLLETANSNASSAGNGKRDRRPSLSGLVASTSTLPTKAALVFPSRKPVSFSFLIFVPENSFSASSLSADPCVFVDKILFTMTSPSPRTPLGAVSPDSTVSGEINGPTIDGTDSLVQSPSQLAPNSQPTSDVKHVIFMVSTLTKAFLAKREALGKSVPLKDICQFLHPNECPALLAIDRLKASLELVYPARIPAPSGSSSGSSSTSTASIFAPPTAKPVNPTQPGTIQLLQGPVQRINLIFKGSGNCVINGKLYLSSDFATVAGSTSSQPNLFWYPDLSSCEEASLQDEVAMDAVKFHPFKLSSSLQPSQPILLPTQHGSDSTFCVPIFVKSEVHTTVTVKLLVEYVPKRRLSSSVTKDFEFKIAFVKPLQMSFALTSLNDNQCGIVREGSVSTVLTGDIISMTATMSCISALNGTLDVLGMHLEQPAENSNSNNRPFKFLDAVSPTKYHFIPYESEKPAAIGDEVVNLTVGEVFVGTVDIACEQPAEATFGAMQSLSDPLRTGSTVVDNLPSTSSVAGGGQIGNLLVAWRFVDASFLLPVDSESIVDAQSSLKLPSNRGPRLSIIADTSEAPAHIADEDTGDTPDETPLSDDAADSGPNQRFKWLHKLLPPSRSEGDPEQTNYSVNPLLASLSALDTSITASRVCEMIFAVPTVSIVNAPFELNIESPPTCTVGVFQSMKIHIISKLWSLERVVIQLVLHENLLVTGSTACTIEIAPCGTSCISVGFAALKCGQVALPQISAIWERNGVPIVDFGSQVSRQLFVFP